MNIMMTKCPITYQELSREEKALGYSYKGLATLSPSLKALKPLKYTAEQQRAEGMQRSAKMSIQGVQSKVSARISIARNEIELVNTGGRFIIKPQSQFYRLLPENEDLTMKMAAVVDIETSAHGLIRSIDHTFSYIIKRFDRVSQKSKLALEDFAQLSNRNRETKYDSSIEQVIKVIDHYCSFPVVEKMRLFRRLLFCYLTGNEDMHLKNFSLITRDKKVELSPAYDLLNTTIAIQGATEESALPIKGKKKGITKQLLTKYLASERLQLTEKIISDEIEKILNAQKEWCDLIKISFLDTELKEAYIALLNKRVDVLSS
ncbi:HipA domain-containing protein [Oligoflexia bacterium]|nr:HipA domain-containing protein [Oligoflexia bacterium]